MKRMLFAITLIISIALITACTPETNETVNETNSLKTNSSTVAETNAPDYQWIQLGEDGAVIARAIFNQGGQACPDIETTDNTDGKASVSMQPRAKNMPDDFAVTVCEATIKDSDKLKSATLAGKSLSLPSKKPERIVLVGDTGCRIKVSKKYTDIQDCNDDNSEALANNNSNSSSNTSNDSSDDWNFRKTIKSALDLKSKKTDLVIHVGDYVYRESECPADKTEECGGSPYGPKWETWETDFFKPAKPLLEAVPWVFVRGNHEDCKREWKGYYLFLDPRPLESDTWQQCTTKQETADPYQVKLDGLNLLVLDSSEEGDQNENILNGIDALKDSTAPAWILTHVPLYKPAPYGAEQPNQKVIDAIKGSKISFLVSGHVHLFEMIQFGDDRPPQIIAGGGATELDGKVSDEDFRNGIKGIGADYDESEVLDKFTFAYVDSENDKWKIIVMDQDGVTEKKTFTIDK